MALRCAAGGGGAYLTPPRSRCCGAGAARPKATTTKARGLGLLPRVASSPSKARWATHLARNIGRNEGWEALKGMVQEMFSPLVGNLSHMVSLRSVYDLEDCEIGMLSGALLGSVGCYQLWKAAPSVFLDTALAYAFYKLSVVSSELHRQGKCNDLFTRLKFGTILVMVLKDIKKNYVLLDLVRMPVFLLYICAFLFDVAGVKKYGRAGLVSLVNILKQGGVQEVFRIMWLPGYVSPYDDGVDWSEARA